METMTSEWDPFIVQKLLPDKLMPDKINVFSDIFKCLKRQVFLLHFSFLSLKKKDWPPERLQENSPNREASSGCKILRGVSKDAPTPT